MRVILDVPVSAFKAAGFSYADAQESTTPLLPRTVFLQKSAADGPDEGSFPSTAGHEVGHVLMNGGTHPPDRWNIMFEDAHVVKQDPSEHEGYGTQKRLTAAQDLLARQAEARRRKNNDPPIMQGK